LAHGIRGSVLRNSADRSGSWSRLSPRGAGAAEVGARSCNPRHRRALPFCVRDICPNYRRSAPGDLTRAEAMAYDVGSALVSGLVLPALTNKQAVELFGEEGTAKLIYLVGLYCMVSVTLNGFDVPIPDEANRLTCYGKGSMLYHHRYQNSLNLTVAGRPTEKSGATPGARGGRPNIIRTPICQEGAPSHRGGGEVQLTG
jgi:hypothetical protein